MISRRGFIGALGMALGAVALPLEIVEAAKAAKTVTPVSPLEGWIPLMIGESPGGVKDHAIRITSAMLDDAAENFKSKLGPRDIPVLGDQHGLGPWSPHCQPVGIISDVVRVANRIDGKLEVRPSEVHVLADYSAIVPVFICGERLGTKLAAMMLTNTPSVPGYERV